MQSGAQISTNVYSSVQRITVSVARVIFQYLKTARHYRLTGFDVSAAQSTASTGRKCVAVPVFVPTRLLHVSPGRAILSTQSFPTRDTDSHVYNAQELDHARGPFAERLTAPGCRLFDCGRELPRASRDHNHL